MTNGDQIRRMTDEELAAFLAKVAGCELCAKHPVSCDCDCFDGYLKFLKEEAIEND